MSRLHRGQIMKGRRVSPATAIALVALFFSLGGAAVASSVSSPSTYDVSARAELPASGTVFLTASCHPGDRVLTGGFSGGYDIVTTSGLIGQRDDRWVVLGHRDPAYVPPPKNASGIGGAAPSPWLGAFAECETG